MPKAKKPSQSGIDTALDSDEQKILEQATKETQSSSSPDTTSTGKRGRGRPKKKGSKRQGVADGTHINLNIIIPVELHDELGLEAFKDKSKDMSDIITGLLKKHYKK